MLVMPLAVNEALLISILPVVIELGIEDEPAKLNVLPVTLPLSTLAATETLPTVMLVLLLVLSVYVEVAVPVLEAAL